MVQLETQESIKKSSRTKFFERYANDVDEFGFNLNAYAGMETFIRFLYKDWFHVQIAGLENVPVKGNALLFGNHSGVLPIDAYLFYDGVINYHPDPRRLRFLVTEFLLKTPVIGKN